MRRAPLAVSFLLLGLLACPAHGTGTGVVEEVVDGDTLRVRTSGNAEAVTVRLIGIDAPERSHPTLGKEFLSDESPPTSPPSAGARPSGWKRTARRPTRTTASSGTSSSHRPTAAC